MFEDLVKRLHEVGGVLPRNAVCKRAEEFDEVFEFGLEAVLDEDVQGFV